MDTSMNSIHTFLNDLNTNLIAKLDSIERRLARLEKMDSIEHHVSVNQIDLTDIKEILYRIEENNHKADKHYVPDDIQTLSSRLDTQLKRIAKLEEEIMLLKQREK
ncbi:hypothetical protein [Bacillus sp. Marseille-P3661]|uniref:hypothetical protein n=1 Tax=Bacillus sp. Marseille-P3661 TaxID=1936234 RepID=UPI000C81C760|nr:hypothetical protein [Bacillus sp. Marseille-P3661]